MPVQRLSDDSKKQIFTAADNTTNFHIWIKVDDHLARLLIDSDCTENFLFSQFAVKHTIEVQKKKESYCLQDFDEIYMCDNHTWIIGWLEVLWSDEA